MIGKCGAFAVLVGSHVFGDKWVAVGQKSRANGDRTSSERHRAAEIGELTPDCASMTFISRNDRVRSEANPTYREAFVLMKQSRRNDTSLGSGTI